MANTPTPQKQKTTKQQQEKLPNQQQNHGYVRQDKIGFSSDRVASLRPDRIADELRSDRLGSFSTQSQNENKEDGALVPLQIWVRPIIRELTLQRARREGLSASAYGRAVYEQALQQQIDIQYSAILIPIIQKAIRDEIRRAVNLLIPLSIDVQMIKQFTSFLVERLPGMAREAFAEVLRVAAARSKSEMAYRFKNLHTDPEKLDDTK